MSRPAPPTTVGGMDASDLRNSPARVAWDFVLGAVVDQAHVATGIQLSETVDRIVQPLGLTVELFIVDLAQRFLRSCGEARRIVGVEGTVGGRAYQFGEIVAGADESGRRSLWIPMLDGADRVGVMAVGLSAELSDDGHLRQRLWSLAGLMGHILVAKMVYGDQLRALRSGGRLSAASELMWDLLTPRTFATDKMVVSALLEPVDHVAGDAYDYAVSSENVDVAVFDGVGHDIAAGLTTALALTAIRNARRSGQVGLLDLAAAADRLLSEQHGRLRFVTAVLARLDTRTGTLDYLLAGHPPPMVLRGSRMVKELNQPPRPPLGIVAEGLTAGTVTREQLEPGDRVLLYSDGVSEARNAQGEFFGERRLIDLSERAELNRLSAPETLRRLSAAVLAHQGGRLQDDATLLIVDWSSGRQQRLFPSLDPGRGSEFR